MDDDWIDHKVKALPLHSLTLAELPFFVLEIRG